MSINAESTMKAAVYVAPNKIELRSIPRPRAGTGELLIRTWGVGLCGTDITKIHYGTASPGTVLGHELAGWVAEVGEGVTDFEKGDRIAAAHHVPCYTCHYCLRGSYSMCDTFKATNFDPGGLAEYVLLSEQHVRHTTFRLPENFAFEEAIFIEPLACCLRGLRRAGIRQGDVVWIIGAGSVGLTMAQAIALLNARVIVSDLIDERLALARQLAPVITANPQRDDLSALVANLSDGRGADVVIPTVLTPRIVQEAIGGLRGGGTLLLYAGTPAAVEIPLDLYNIWRNEINLISSYSPDPTSMADAYDLLNRQLVRMAPTISHHLPLEETGRAVQMVADAEALKVVISIA